MTNSRPSRFLVVGCGHTGTTLISGIMHINGYDSFNVSRLFENRRLNDLNKRLLIGAPEALQDVPRFLDEVERRTKGRWCLKDPRLSETVAHFYEHISQPVGIIFNIRRPESTVRSLLMERQMHERHLTLDEMVRDSEDEWLRRNLAVMRFLDTYKPAHVLLVSYDALVDREFDETLCRFVGRPLDMTFIDPFKRRSQPIAVRPELTELYDRLVLRFEANRRDVLRSTHPVTVMVRRDQTLRTKRYVQANRITNGLRRRLRRLRR
jgi:hypothetical protein